jgi:hypothetical protein
MKLPEKHSEQGSKTKPARGLKSVSENFRPAARMVTSVVSRIRKTAKDKLSLAVTNIDDKFDAKKASAFLNPSGVACGIISLAFLGASAECFAQNQAKAGIFCTIAAGISASFSLLIYRLYRKAQTATLKA